MAINSNLPSIQHLREKARRRMPGFAFDYLEGGCNSNINLRRNTDEIREIQLRPYYIRDYPGCELKTDLFGHTYDAPFGIAPIGLQGLMWPKATEILAASAKEHNIPFILSTVGTASIETVAELTDGIGQTGIKPAFIKVGASDISAQGEVEIHRAAAQAAAAFAVNAKARGYEGRIPGGS